MERRDWLILACTLVIIATLIGCASWLTHTQREQAHWIVMAASAATIDACHPADTHPLWNPWVLPPQP